MGGAEIRDRGPFKSWGKMAVSWPWYTTTQHTHVHLWTEHKHKPTPGSLTANGRFSNESSRTEVGNLLWPIGHQLPFTWSQPGGVMLPLWEGDTHLRSIFAMSLGPKAEPTFSAILASFDPTLLWRGQKGSPEPTALGLVTLIMTLWQIQL